MKRDDAAIFKLVVLGGLVALGLYQWGSVAAKCDGVLIKDAWGLPACVAAGGAP